MALLTLISWDFSNIENIFYFSFIATFISFVVLQARVQAKYKIPDVADHQASVSVYSSQHPLYDMDSTIPGGAAYSTRQALDRLKQ